MVLIISEFAGCSCSRVLAVSVPFAVTRRVDIPMLQFVVAKDGALRRVFQGGEFLVALRLVPVSRLL